jgi:hypothetical protein
MSLKEKIFRDVYFASAAVMMTVALIQPIILADTRNKEHFCLEKVVESISRIRLLPERKYLYTLDGQQILLNDLFDQCKALHPWCCLFKKFYYWDNAIKIIDSVTTQGQVIHKIRIYSSPLSTHCPDSCDAGRTHGDVAEFYDANGRFMGLSVYMGQGKYCPLPHIVDKKSNF